VITTLGTMFLFKGIGQTLGTAYSYNAPSITNAAFLRFGRGYLLESIALPFVYFLLILLILHFFLRLTKMGHDIYTTGASTSLARIFGVNVRRAQFLTFVLSGCLAGFAAALSVAQLARTDPYFGQGLEFQALTITVLGGISLAGGRGSLLGVLLAVLIVGSISNGLAVVKVPVNMRDAINGIILIAALLIDSVRQRSIGFRS
jgi:ribose transport system permease protein